MSWYLLSDVELLRKDSESRYPEFWKVLGWRLERVAKRGPIDDRTIDILTGMFSPHAPAVETVKLILGLQAAPSPQPKAMSLRAEVPLPIHDSKTCSLCKSENERRASAMREGQEQREQVLRRAQRILNIREYRRRIKLHFSQEDLAIPSTWWEQARFIAVAVKQRQRAHRW